ncbi:MAG TPA: KpsF/GutQ family sugar-phosphate isomerase, partial [Anaeromyxobacteraceae bacterium]
MPARRARPGRARRGRDPLAWGRAVLAAEAGAIARLRLGASFATAVRWILACAGRVVVTGMGKPGFVAQKISATLASTGTPSLFVHPADAAHGDLGRIARDDIVLALSNSGETEEILRLLPALRRIGARVVALTRDRHNPLARGAHLVVPLGPVEEACPLGLAPTASTTAALALGDALAMALVEKRGFTVDDFAVLHPGGRLGRKLLRVEDAMHAGDGVPRVAPETKMKDVLFEMTR